MLTVFLSSVARGLEQYREATYRAIEGLDGYHCVRMEDFGARADTPYEVCLKRVQECDILVAIVGHNYGSIAIETGKSYSESEYDIAAAAGKQLLVFLAPEEFPLPANLIESDELRKKQSSFRARVGKETIAFIDPDGAPPELGAKVIQAIHNHRAQMLKEGRITEGTVVAKLLFPYVTNQRGFDTGIAISNISDDPFGTVKQDGTCAIHFYGVAEGQRPKSQTSGVIQAGEQLVFTLSSEVSSLIAATPGFQGYLIVECRFKAVGVAFISDVGAQKLGSFCYAQVI